MKLKLIVLKLGGSVITKKEKPVTPNLRAIDRLAHEISMAKVPQLIIVHGGGSFGHPIAKQHAIKEGFKEKTQLRGFSETHHAMATLNGLVIDALIRHNIPAVGVAPSSIVLTKSGRIEFMEEKILTKALEKGFVPVLYGDAVLDSDIGFTILSGDQIVSATAIMFNAERIVIGVDVDGLYTSDPKTNKSARLIEHLTLRELKTLQKGISEANVTDVTGGMLGKIAELTPAVESGITPIIANAAKPNRIYKALKGEKVNGTIIEKE